MGKSQTVQVRLTLQGPAADVMEFVALAMGDGLVKSLDIEDTPTPATNGTRRHVPARRGSETPNAARARRAQQKLEVGDRVFAVNNDTYYHLTQGQQGEITAIGYRGRGRRLTVKWDNGDTSIVGASMVQRLRRNASVI